MGSVAKAFSVLHAFGPDLPELTIAEIAARTVQNRGAAFRLAHTLVALGYLDHMPETRRFRLSLKCLELGFSALAANDLPTHARPLLSDVAPRISDSASLGALDRGDVVYLQRVEAAAQPVSRRAGSRTGAYAAALGHAILAFLPRDAQIAHLDAAPRVKLSERTLVDLDALIARLDEVRARGFAVSDGENAYGLRTVAAPVLDAGGKPVAGVSLTINAARMSVDDFVALAAPHAIRIAEKLGQASRLSLGAIALPQSGAAS
ncbi:IclR family transcriptional regulator [Chenggangzhangella methanolivorans]|uniref:Helix-turn-helix domain-containing protein n=1 Tax=Chenggangzhangella methanolivorans TaxID=1437009 RepID=A0A9E6R5N4_9HYPH|nr:IclR family transcriptional regulator C-terminal domain-containing protein [Chenggangzhangella methanolivorans]QZN98642.1 helix-turn-helix domain-containing protein [Chenggangzhangella methanolivorans]